MDQIPPDDVIDVQEKTIQLIKSYNHILKDTEIDIAMCAIISCCLDSISNNSNNLEELRIYHNTLRELMSIQEKSYRAYRD